MVTLIHSQACFWTVNRWFEFTLICGFKSLMKELPYNQFFLIWICRVIVNWSLLLLCDQKMINSYYWVLFIPQFLHSLPSLILDFESFFVLFYCWLFTLVVLPKYDQTMSLYTWVVIWQYCVVGGGGIYIVNLGSKSTRETGFWFGIELKIWDWKSVPISF